MFKVLKEVAEVTSSGTKGETEIKVGGRVRSASMKEMVAKQLKTGFDSLDWGNQEQEMQERTNCGTDGFVRPQAVCFEATKLQNNYVEPNSVHLMFSFFSS